MMWTFSISPMAHTVHACVAIIAVESMVFRNRTRIYGSGQVSQQMEEEPNGINVAYCAACIARLHG